MTVSIILGHPNPGSFCHAIAAVARDALLETGYDIAFHDLHQEGFDPLVGADEARTRQSADQLVEDHCRELAGAEGLIIVHPSWWGMPPAILKGWIDRVVRPGVAYRLKEDAQGAPTVHVGLLTSCQAIVFNTSDLPVEAERNKFGDTLNVIWKTYVGALSGMPVERHAFAVMGTSTPDDRARWLDEARDIVSKRFPARKTA